MHLNGANPMIPEKKDEIPVGDLIHTDKDEKCLTKAVYQGKLSVSPEVFITDDNIIHTQESQAQDGAMEDVVPQEVVVPSVSANPSGGGYKCSSHKTGGVKGSRKTPPSLPRRRMRGWLRKEI
jgi:hypothetical protein